MGPERRVLLTGATGFVGGHLARALVARGDRVTALVRAGSPPVPPGVEALVVPGGTDDLEATVRGVHPDVAVHLATHFVARHTSTELVDLLEANVVFGTRLAEALVAAGRVPLVDTGTVWQRVGGAAYRPANLYAATKQAYADIVASYALNEGLAVARLTLTDTYGPDDRRAKLVPALVRSAHTGEPLELSSGQQLVDLVHVDDVVAAYEVVMDRLVAGDPAPGAVAEHGCNAARPLTVRELVALVDELLGRPLPVRWGARPDRPVEMRERWSAGVAPPGWQPRVPLPAGLAALLGTNLRSDPATTMP